MILIGVSVCVSKILISFVWLCVTLLFLSVTVWVWHFFLLFVRVPVCPARVLIKRRDKRLNAANSLESFVHTNWEWRKRNTLQRFIYSDRDWIEAKKEEVNEKCVYFFRHFFNYFIQKFNKLIWRRASSWEIYVTCCSFALFSSWRVFLC